MIQLVLHALSLEHFMKLCPLERTNKHAFQNLRETFFVDTKPHMILLLINSVKKTGTLKTVNKRYIKCNSCINVILYHYIPEFHMEASLVSTNNAQDRSAFDPEKQRRFPSFLNSVVS